jgi:hypothetical protein
MKHVFSVVSGCALIAVAASAQAQSPQAPPRIVGNRVSGTLQLDAATHLVTETATLTFQNSGSGEVYTIDFIARHPVQQPVPAPGVVDIVVTQHSAEDDAPDMTLRVDGDTVPLVTRLHSRRSVVASVSLTDLERIASAAVVVDRTFNTELEFGPGQVRMVRATADRWLGR